MQSARDWLEPGTGGFTTAIAVEANGRAVKCIERFGWTAPGHIVASGRVLP
jgi:hypothetical protein